MLKWQRGWLVIIYHCYSILNKRKLKEANDLRSKSQTDLHSDSLIHILRQHKANLQQKTHKKHSYELNLKNINLANTQVQQKQQH